MTEAVKNQAAKTETKTIVKSTAAQVSDMLRERKSSLEQLVPKHLTAERLMRVAVNCIAKTPGLQKCTPTSLLQSILIAAELGLEPGGALGHMYLVPFKDQCTPIIGYRGFLELARRTGQLKSFRAVVVYAKETFKVVEGLHFDIIHERSLSPDRGDLVAVYAVAELADGSVQFEVMTRTQVDAIRRRSRSGDNGPWVTDYEEMAKKTVSRRLAKWMPLASERFDRALELDSNDYVDAETGEVVPADSAAAATLKEKVKTRMLIDTVDVPPDVTADTVVESTAAPGEAGLAS